MRNSDTAPTCDIESEQVAFTDDGRAYLTVEFGDGVGFGPFYGVIEITGVPAPGTVSVLGVLGLAGMRRRR